LLPSDDQPLDLRDRERERGLRSHRGITGSRSRELAIPLMTPVWIGPDRVQGVTATGAEGVTTDI
jgi:hypothetical protein